MKASVVEKVGGQFITEEVILDSPLDLEVLLDVQASGLCHSDLHVAHDGYGNSFPAVLGHEVAGVVKEVGKQVTEFKVGDHVVGCLIQFCGHCEACLSGHTYRCLHKEETLRLPNTKPRITRPDGSVVYQGMGLGGFAEQALVHQNQLVKVPKEVPFSRACILGCGTITGAGAMINTAKIRPGNTVAVIGLGGVGLNAISGARIAGATTIIAIDLQPNKLALAKKFGATHTIHSGEVDAVAAVHEITQGGVDAAFEIIGLKPTAQQALAMAKEGGGAYLIGLQKPGRLLEIDGSPELIFSQKKLQGVWMGSSNFKYDIPMYAKLYLEGRLNLDDLISQEIHIDQVQASYDELEKGAIARSIITAF
ncbi:Zn-dependent alcohol dehydrogenase [Neisseria sp. Ec49-e6-T10]|uniref:Zn-dependent alcohol dehydrogenase n=1 Tax=Neisseria sp. Ec49-e6-T10 TaxID=3140744 RepID=UPI003EBAE471